MVRISGGRLRGRILAVPVGERDSRLRPTTGLVREGVFSSLDSRGLLDESSVVDLYAGTGALGFEALSRGAVKCIFVEKDPEHAQYLINSATKLDLEHSTQIVRSSTESFLERWKGEASSLILADPPYTAHPGNELLIWLVRSSICTEGTTVVIGSPSKLLLKERVEEGEKMLEQSGRRRYGSTAICYYSCRVTEGEG